MREFLRIALLPLLLLLVGAPSLPAQEADANESAAGTEPGAEPFAETVDVEVVNVDVWVTDADGDPVPGLERDDFRVLRDGTTTTVTNFYAVADGRPVAEAAPSLPATSAPEGAPEPTELPRIPQEPEVAEEHRLWMVVYVDNYNLDPIERDRTLPMLRQFLGQTLRRGDQVMLVTYDRGLEVEQGFTGSQHLILAALDELYGQSGHVVVRRREQDRYLRLIQESERPAQALGVALTYAETLMDEVERSADAMQRLIETMAGLPGRKALVHLSSGIPMAAGEEMFHYVAEKFNESRAYAEIGRHDTSRAFERVARHANTHRTVFYTIDAGGFRGMHFGGAEYDEFVDPGIRSMLDSVVSENNHAPLRLVAQETGGRAILNQNDILPALEKVSQDFRTFYSLGISHVDAAEGRYHDLEVELTEEAEKKLKERGVRKVELRHRKGYRSKSLDRRMTDGLRSALLYAQEDNPLGIDVRWGKPRPHGDDGETWLMPIQLRVPLRDVVLLPTAGGKHELRLLLYVGVADERGDVSEIDRAPIGLRIADEHVEAAKGESFVHTHQLLLNEGRKKVGVSVLDRVGRESSVVTRVVQVGRK